MNAHSGIKWQRIKQFLKQDVWEIDLPSVSGIRRTGLHALRIVLMVVKGFREDSCPVHASALTFISVMALVPFLVILFAVAKGFGFEQASALLLERTREMPDTFQEAVGNIMATVESASAGAIGSIGTVVFLWVTIKMLSNIEETFNLVWGVKTPRPLIDKIRNYVVILVAAPLLLIIASAGQPLITGLTSRLEWMGFFFELGLRSVPVLSVTTAFAIVYVFLPNTKVQLSAAVTGALVAAILAGLFQKAMIELGIGVSRYNRIYGTLAAIPLFLFWMQVSWMILLMGAEVAFSVQNTGTYARERLAVNPSARSRLCLAFALMKKITGSFYSGNGPFNVLQYGQQNRIPVRLVNDVINILAKNGLVVQDANHPGAYALLSNPESVSARVVAEAILNEGADPDELGMRDDFPLFGKIIGESFESLEKQTLTRF